MNWSEICSIISIFVSFIALGISLFFGNSQKKCNQATIELEIHSMISNAKDNLNNVLLKYVERDKSTLDENDKNIYLQSIEGANESFLNAYEQACAKYLDNKVDKVRFKKNYAEPIRNLIKDKNNSDKFERSTVYHAIVKVHDEWYVNE